MASTTWTGGSSTLWSVSGNWSAGVPTSTTDVIIPNTTRLPTVDINSSCKSVTISGNTTLTLSANLTVSGGLTVNGGATFNFSGTKTVTFASSSSIGNPGVLNINSGPTVTFSNGLSVNAGGKLYNAGNLNSTSSSGITSGNPGTIVNYSTGIITLTGSLLSVGGGTNITNSGQIIANSSSSIVTNNPVTFINNSGASISLTGSTLLFGGGTTVTNDGSISASSTSTITCNNPVPIANTGSISLSASTMALNGGSHISNSGSASVSAVSGSTITFQNPSYIDNTSSGTSLTVSASTLDIEAGGYIKNSGTVNTSASSTVKLNGNPVPITNNVGATFTSYSTAFTMVAGTTITNTGGTFTLSSCTVDCSGNPTSITNQNSGSTTGIFTLDNTALTFNGTNSIINYGLFTAMNGSSINMTSSSATSAITNYGTFYAGTSNSSCIITLNGNQPKLTNASSGTNGNFYLGSTSIIYPTSTNCLMTNNSSCTFTLQSDRYGSAAIGAVPNGANPSPSLVGIYNVERFFQGGSTYDNVKGRWVERNYRIISSPVNTGSKVNSNYIYGLNYIVGSTAGHTTDANSTTNSFISGATGGNTSAGNPSIYLYRENKASSNAGYTAGNFVGITNITNASSLGTTDAGSWTIPIGNGVLFFFRGAATNWTTRTSAPFIAPEDVTLTSTGYLNQQSVTVKDWYTPTSSYLGYTNTTGSLVKGFNMVGNPYACTIDYDKVSSGGITATNIDPTIYVLDPVTCQYLSFSSSTHVGTFSGKIVSGQGFFAKALSATASLTFNESCKSPTSQLTGGNLLMGTPAQQEVAKLMRLKLSIDAVNSDEILIGFRSSASTAYNGYEDAKDLGGISAPEGLSSYSSDNVPLAINFLPLPSQKPLEIRLDVEANASRRMTLEKIGLDSIPKIYEIWLMDKFKKDSLDLRNNSSYVFDINLADTNSFGGNRFSIVIRQNKSLGLHLLDFAATKATAGAQLDWKTENEENYTNFTVERSTDNGVTFDVLGGFLSSSQGTYNFTDKTPAKAVNIYHIKMEDLNGTISYSGNIPLNYGDANTTAATSNIDVYPNPAVSTINLAIKPDTKANLLSGLQSIDKSPGLASTKSQTYAIRIVNITGKVVKSAISAQPNWQDNIQTLIPGTYIIQVVNNSDNSVVGKTTFVKM